MRPSRYMQMPLAGSKRLRLHLPLAALLAGCSTASKPPAVAMPAVTSGFHGAVHGGQQPISGATIHIYAVGTTGDGSAASSVLATALTTDPNGYFDLTNKIICPTPTSLLYLVATGGNPGLPPPANNPQSTLIVALGQCSNPGNIQFINVNEVTTVAAIYALAPYIGGLTSIGSGSTDAAALSTAFTLAAQLANITNGSSPGTNIPVGVIVPTAQINTLANLLSACVNSSGGVSGDTSICGQLFALLPSGGNTPPADTAMALLNLALNPSLNTSGIYNLILPVAPFQPTITLLPPDFGVRPTYPFNFTVSPPSLSFGAAYIGATTSTQSITVTNNTANTFSITGTTISGADPGDFVYTPQTPPNACPTPMLPGISCTFPVAFQPTAGGVRHGYFVINNTSVNPFLPIPLSGIGTVGIASSISVSPTSLAFSSFNVPQDVTLTNAGSTTLNINAIRFTSGSVPSSAYTETDTCGPTLLPQSICTIHVTAHASANGSNAVMTIADDAITGPQTVSLTSQAYPFYAPDSIDFGPTSLGTTALGNLVFTNPNPPNFIGTIFNFPPTNPAFSLSGIVPSSSDGQCGWPIGATYCYTNLYFTPAVLGTVSTQMFYEVPPYNNVGGYISVTGTGVGPGPYFVASAEPAYPSITNYSPTTSVSFNTPVGVPQTITFRVRPTGTAQPSIPAPVVSGPHSAEFTGTSTCASGGICTITLTYTPTRPANFIAYAAFVESANTFQQNFIITANATGGSVTATPSQLDFPDTRVGTISSPISTTITTLSNDPVSATVSGPFLITQGATCTSTPCQLTVEFAPPSGSPGYETGSITLKNLTSGGTISIPLNGTGTAGTSGPASVSPTSLPITGYNLGGTNIYTMPVTLTNSGTQPLTIQGITFTLSSGTTGYYTETDTCGAVLAALSSCTITVNAHPILTTNSAATMTIMDDASNGPQVVNLSFVNNGYVPEDTIDFGVYSIGNTGYTQLRMTKLPGNTDSTPRDRRLSTRHQCV